MCANEFVYTPAGTIHGIEGKLMMAEVQQSSDVTYRIYDYDRKDANGNMRELHIDQAIEVTNIPHIESDVHPTVTMLEGNEVVEYVNEKYFKEELLKQQDKDKKSLSTSVGPHRDDFCIFIKNTTLMCKLIRVIFSCRLHLKPLEHHKNTTCYNKTERMPDYGYTEITARLSRNDLGRTASAKRLSYAVRRC